MYAGYKRNRDGSVIPRKRVGMRLKKAISCPHNFARYVKSIQGMSVNNGTYSTATSCLFSSVAGGVTETDFAAYFIPADCEQFNELSVIFDQFKLTCVVLTIKLVNVPDANSVITGTTNNYTNFYPTLWYAPDHDDAATTTLDLIKQRADVRHKVLRPNQEIKIVLRPSVIQSGITAAAGTATYATYLRPWINSSASANVAYYGIKGVIDFEGQTTTTTAGNQWQFKINARYYYKFKNPI